MAKLQLSNRVTLDIEDNGKVIKTFKVNLRELTKKEERTLSNKNKKVFDLYNKSTKLEKRLSVFEDKIEAYKELEQFEKVLKETTKLEKLYAEQDEIEAEFEKLGGLDTLTEASKETFDITVSGDEKEGLREWIEGNNDYATILALLKEDAKEKKGS